MEKKGIIKIGIVGPESTGKSVLCEQLAKHYTTKFVPEFARDYFTTHSIHSYTLQDLESIYTQQLALENQLIKNAHEFLFCDTTLLSGKVWALEVFNTVPKVIDENLKKETHQLYLLCDLDLPWVQDEQRMNKHNRDELFQDHITLLNELDANYEIISGKHEHRLLNAIKAIEKRIKTNKSFQDL